MNILSGIVNLLKNMGNYWKKGFMQELIRVSLKCGEKGINGRLMNLNRNQRRELYTYRKQLKVTFLEEERIRPRMFFEKQYCGKRAEGTAWKENFLRTLLNQLKAK